ncbi:MAG: manganese transporter [Chloroflexi bacterium]|nr:MAG: manganese transporter [Chloroflexota bacterium]MBL1194790.1 manganese transporter [Chloroflexota bacterium]NOH12082.1 zinc ABC transporter solute-binding protein [Chloroflexota bacterium]
MISRKLLVGAFVALSFLLVACTSSVEPTNNDDGILDVVATIGQIQDVTENIGGDLVDVTVLMGQGVDPHLYVPIESDLEAFQNADVILYSGINLEAQMIDVMNQIGESRGVPTVAVAETIPQAQLLDYAGGGPGTSDPHVWGDVALWSFAAESIRDTLVAADPDNAEIYNANYDAYKSDLDALHGWAIESIASIPDGQRKLVTAHDAFQYFGKAYNIEVFAPQGISTAAEASVADIQTAVDYIVTNDVPAIFFESAIPIDTVEAMIEGASAREHSVELGGELFADTMGEPGTLEGTYLGMIEHNVTVIVEALGGTVAQLP